MTTTLTTPESLNPVTQHRVISEQVSIAYNNDGTPDTSKIYFKYIVQHYTSNGDVVRTIEETVPFSVWPAGFKTDVKAVHDKVIIDARNKGHIGTGTDSDDMP